MNILREAYVKSINNPKLVAEAKKARMDMEPMTGEQLQALAKRVITQPPGVLKRVKKKGDVFADVLRLKQKLPSP